MNERVTKLTGEAGRLTPEEQAELLDALTAMVHADDHEIDPAPLEECERRWERHKARRDKVPQLGRGEVPHLEMMGLRFLEEAIAGLQP